MEENTKTLLQKPGESFEDALTSVLRTGAKDLLQKAIEAEIAEHLKKYEELVLSDGRQRIVRDGYHPQRTILTGIGEVEVRLPNARDRSGQKEFQFRSNILPPYLRKIKSIEALIPWLYLKGISTGDFPRALEALVGPHAKGLSASTVSRLKEVCLDELRTWQKRDLSRKRYVYFWADGIHANVRMDQDKQCLLVIVGATSSGKKELIALDDGYRESEQSWKEVLLDLKERGLSQSPKLAVGDGAKGF